MVEKGLRYSPTSINTFMRCPRLFYYNYILKRRSPPNIHLYKGNFVHKVLENVFKNTRYVNIKDYGEKCMVKWKPSLKFFKDEKDAEFHREETKRIINMIALRFENKLDMIILEGKAKDKNHAWNLIKPKLREHKLFDKEKNLVGIIDSVEVNFDDLVYLIDYKTSKLYRHTITEEYIRQVGIYAYLYWKEYGKRPDFVGVNYLRYGEVFIIPVTDELINKTLEDIDFVVKNTKSRNKNDYPRCNHSWCDCVTFEKEKENDIKDSI